ncbi:MAG: GNAT family N-acetyltransferase [Kangiellaceae bacterium]|nr:GNAT family N-acetyltransferase [Kangiellaceae bacterium]
MSNFNYKFITSIDQVVANDWNSLICSNYPFIRHEFLAALEFSGSVSEQSGWQPRHLLIYSSEQLIGFMPLYLKTNSYGEYVFDFQWADAYHQSGLQYYPKLVTSVPFTPCEGPRLVVKPEFQQLVIAGVIEQVVRLAKELAVSSWHLLFPSAEQEMHLNGSQVQPNAQLQKELLLLRRSGVQYHWFNQDYNSFDDFLTHCKLKKRKNIKRERKRLDESGVKLQFVEGIDASGKLWMQFFEFYQLTYLKRSGNYGYLNWQFFEFIARAMPEQVMFVVASNEDKVVGMSLFFKGDSTLYGRYWGSSEEFEFLHFEACYYQGIEYCIKNKLGHFDAGAQGEHKIQRGFTPIETCSYHWIGHPQFKAAIDNFVREEKHYVDNAIKALSLKLPFKR